MIVLLMLLWGGCRDACDKGSCAADDTEPVDDTDTPEPVDDTDTPEPVDDTDTPEPGGQLPDIRPAALLAERVMRVAPGEPCPEMEGAVLQGRLMGRYCRYQTDPGWAPPTATPAGAIDVDYLAVNPNCVLGDGVPERCDDIQQYWQNTMSYASGWAQADGCVACRLRAAVPRLEILDSMPDPEVNPVQPLDGAANDPPGDTNAHGMSLYRVASRSTCGSAGVVCPVEVRARQVLGLLPGRNGNAGQWGSFLDLAAGIEGAVDDWLDDRGATFTDAGLGDAVPGGTRSYQVGPLVLNLSLGWSAVFGGGVPGTMAIDAEGTPVPRFDGADVVFSWRDVDPEQFPLGVRAVFDALVYARCHGALVVAAAGNSTSGPLGNQGPILPAAWEAMPTEMLPSCDTVRRADAADLPEIDPDMPLIVAVGSLTPSPDLTGVVEAPFARPGARPTLLAYGHEGVSGQVSGGHVMQPLSGTSMSSVLVASTAALYMAIREEASPLAALRAMTTPIPDPGGDSQLDYDNERDRQFTDLTVSPAFAATAARFGGDGRSVWVRACGLLLSDGWHCVAPQAWPTNPGVMGISADWGEAEPLEVVDAEEDPQALYSPSISPVLYTQPDWPLCPECLLVRNFGRLILDFVVPAGTLVSVSLAPDPDSATPPAPFAVPLSRLTAAGTRYTLDALIQPLDRVEGVKALRVDLIVTDGVQRRTSRMWVPVIQAVAGP